jgi:DNA sulfur modification protein DndB
MAAFEYSLPAVRGVQAGRDYYVTMCPLGLVARLFLAGAEGLPSGLQAQRVLNKGRVSELARYLTGHPNSYVLPALVASVDGAVVFDPLPGVSGPAAPGLLRVPLNARLLLHDGLHRRAAVEALLLSKPELADETISVVLFVDPGFQRAEQLSTDLKRAESGPAPARGGLLDRRDETANLARALAERVEVFAGVTEMVSSKLSNRTTKLFTLSGIYHATKALLADQKETPFSSRLDLAVAFWSAVGKHIPDWRRAKAGEVSPGDLRKRYIHAHGLALAALGRTGRSLFQRHPRGWKPKLRALEEIDWSRDNTQVWEGRAMVGGRLSKATACVVLTGNVLKQSLDLPLTPDEQEIEDQFRSRSG